MTKYLTSLRIVGKDINLYACLKESINKAPEFHHLLYKAKYPDLVTDPKNVMLVGRIESEKILGPGQQELINLISSANAKDKFKVLLLQFVKVYQDWLGIE